MTAWILSIALAAALTGPSVSPLVVNELHNNYAVDGVIDSAYRIAAAKQNYTLILSRTGNFAQSSNSDERSARLYATLFAEQGDEHMQVWLIQDRVDACPFDITAEFTQPALSVSDADGDGEAEFWVGYRVSCRSDVSPATLKLIGYEGAQKYVLRGSARLQLGDSSEGGEYVADAALQKAPALLEHAS